MAGGESQRHRRLKQAGLRWLAEHRYAVRATEIRLLNSNFRADVVAYRPAVTLAEPEDVVGERPRRTRQHQIGMTAVLECKQARSDFLKDTRCQGETLRRLQHWHQRRETLERLLGVHHPSLRQGETLFPEFDVVDLSTINHATYKRVLREIQVLDNRLHHKTKLEKLIRYRCANLCYVVAFEGIVRAHELPWGWGLLELASEDESERLTLTQRPSLNDVAVHRRLELLHLIAAASSGRWNREQGLEESWNANRPSEPDAAPKND